jgi:hypothetical protein
MVPWFFSSGKRGLSQPEDRVVTVGSDQQAGTIPAASLSPRCYKTTPATGPVVSRESFVTANLLQTCDEAQK